MKIGYARVSTDSQSLALQLDALKAAGCERIYQDHASGKTASRPELDKCLESLSAGDTLTVWKLDRLGRSTRHLVNTISELGERGVEFRSITDGIETSTAAGKLVFTVLSGIAEFERDLIAERSAAGRKAAQARGTRFGRPLALTSDRIKRGRALVASGESVAEVAKLLGVSRMTGYRMFGESVRR